MAGWGICDDRQQHRLLLLLCAARYHVPGDVTATAAPTGTLCGWFLRHLRIPLLLPLSPRANKVPRVDAHRRRNTCAAARGGARGGGAGGGGGACSGARSRGPASNELRDSKPQKARAIRMKRYRPLRPTRIRISPTVFLSLSTSFLGAFCRHFGFARDRNQQKRHF